LCTGDAYIPSNTKTSYLWDSTLATQGRANNDEECVPTNGQDNETADARDLSPGFVWWLNRGYEAAGH